MICCGIPACWSGDRLQGGQRGSGLRCASWLMQDTATGLHRRRSSAWIWEVCIAFGVRPYSPRLRGTVSGIRLVGGPSVSGSGETPGATVTGGNLRARRDQQTVTMTSSDMQDTPAGRRAARADGPRSSQPKRRTFTAAYKMAMIEKYDAATEPGAKGVLLRGEGLYDSHIS